MDMVIKHVVELSPASMEFLQGLASAVKGNVEVQSKKETICECSQKDENPTTADAETPQPVKRVRKPRAKKQAEAEEVVAEPEVKEVEPEVAIEPEAEQEEFSAEITTKIAYAAFQELSIDPEAPVGPLALTTKMREIILGAKKAHDPDNHENAAISDLSPEQRVEFINYVRAEGEGMPNCGHIVERILKEEV